MGVTVGTEYPPQPPAEHILVVPRKLPTRRIRKRQHKNTEATMVRYGPKQCRHPDLPDGMKGHASTSTTHGRTGDPLLPAAGSMTLESDESNTRLLCGSNMCPASGWLPHVRMDTIYIEKGRAHHLDLPSPAPQLHPLHTAALQQQHQLIQQGQHPHSAPLLSPATPAATANMAGAIVNEYAPHLAMDESPASVNALKYCYRAVLRPGDHLNVFAAAQEAKDEVHLIKRLSSLINAVKESFPHLHHTVRVSLHVAALPTSQSSTATFSTTNLVNTLTSLASSTTAALSPSSSSTDLPLHTTRTQTPPPVRTSSTRSSPSRSSSPPPSYASPAGTLILQYIKRHNVKHLIIGTGEQPKVHYVMPSGPWSVTSAVCFGSVAGFVVENAPTDVMVVAVRHAKERKRVVRQREFDDDEI
ncbi:uncharacterized protein EV422DRAFT_503597 [Fimicolochytrium jonesii]|uniref:uncharacterized protein n=1 Tax=Fimicolochytrium jonesii TaxID=1396493 RepID=UPI0022FEB38C|nr:uncharacterized protein EV422DRAFT_503597 [Fimicolochytrium jonesii]KAI8824784.1 hypothetical protein EV422DRAFT_503597 [Fimicolochytrium jonesii]